MADVNRQGPAASGATALRYLSFDASFVPGVGGIAYVALNRSADNIEGNDPGSISGDDYLMMGMGVIPGGGPLGKLGKIAKAAKGVSGAEELIGGARTYVDLTRGGSVRNIGTNATHTEFGEALKSGGWTSRVSKDGAVQIFEKDGAKYVLREKADSYSGWTGEFTPAESPSSTLKIRLGYGNE